MDENKDKDSYPSRLGKLIIAHHIFEDINNWSIEEIPPTEKSNIRKIIFTRKEEFYE
jgi:hypothetical protein